MPSSGSPDDVKQKFREALERKKNKNATSSDDHPDAGTSGPEQGHEQKAKTQRMYRRKAV